jgi:hypothetical protein
MAPEKTMPFTRGCQAKKAPPRISAGPLKLCCGSGCVVRAVQRAGLAQGLGNVFNNIIHVLNANGEPDRVGPDARFGKFCVGELRMRGRGGVDYQRFCIRHVGQQGEDLQPVDECPGLRRAALDLKGKDGAAPLGK